MVDISAFTDMFLQALTDTFGERVWFVGLQGSYARGDATAASDIDLVVILDELTATDIEAYDAMLNTLPHRELVCGFLAGKQELLHWEPSDLFQFYYDTHPVKGTLCELENRIDAAAVRRAVQSGVCNLYHACVHNMLYEKSEDILRSLYKSASFTVQAIHFERTGQYVRPLRELLAVTATAEREILQIFADLKNGGAVDFPKMSDILLNWCKNHIH